MKPCLNRKQCGGCLGMTCSYDESLKEKKRRIQLLFPKEIVCDPIGMPDPYHYRHKIYAVFGKNRRGQIVAGMYEENSHRLVPVVDCAIQHPLANQIIVQICHIADSMKLAPYDEDKHHGVLRQVYIRISGKTQKALAVLVVGSRELPGAHYFAKQLKQHCPQMETLVLNWNHQQTSMVLGDRFKVLYGRGWIEDAIGGVKFRISPSSFYQVNPKMTEVLYRTALEMASIRRDDCVLDVCCGIGTISLLAAAKAKSVIGIEINPQAVRDAKYNAQQNGIANVRFICVNEGHYKWNGKDHYDIVIADPPRAGLSADFLHMILRYKPRTFVYISCNPVTQARDIEMLKGYYRIRKIVPVDLFPWTEHVETIALLCRKDIDNHIEVKL